MECNNTSRDLCPKDLICVQLSPDSSSVVENENIDEKTYGESSTKQNKSDTTLSS